MDMAEKPWGRRSRLRSVSETPGGEAVGKTTFVKYFAEHPFPMEHIQTIGVDFTVVPRGVIAGRQVYLHFFDVSSAEQRDVNSSALQLALQEASGIFLLFDATEYSSFKEVDEINAILKYLYSSNNNLNKRPPPMLLLAHKADLMSVDRRSLLTTQDILQFVENNEMVGYRWTSLQNRQSVNDAVQALVEAALLSNGDDNDGDPTNTSVGVIDNLLQNTYSWPNMSETGGIKTRINRQLMRSTTLINMNINQNNEKSNKNNNNNNEHEQQQLVDGKTREAVSESLEITCKKLKLKRESLLSSIENIINKNNNSTNKSVEEINIEIELIDSCVNMYNNRNDDDDNGIVEEFISVSHYLLSPQTNMALKTKMPK